jgi:muramoyltetrapeptide carboxypeptidase
MKPKITIPEYLKKNDTVAIIAPAGIVTGKHINNAINFFTKNNFKIKKGQYLHNKKGIFAADDKMRLDDFNSMLYDDNIKAIIALRGGYGTARIINKINTGHLKKHPKWIIGFSDITVLHLALSKLNIASIHGTMPVNFDTTHKESLTSLLDCLSGKKIKYKIKNHELARQGKAEALLTGGNLSIIYSLNSTPYEINTDNKILFIEDLSEYLYHIDRMMLNLKLSGKLDKLKALIVGGMNNMKNGTTNFGKTAYEIIYDYVKNYNYPLIFGFPAGHIHKNLCLKMNTTIKIEVTHNNSTIEFLN